MGFFHFVAVEVGAFHLGGDQKTLCLSAEQQDGGIGRTALVEEVEMLQDLMRRRVPRQGEIAATPGQDNGRWVKSRVDFC